MVLDVCSNFEGTPDPGVEVKTIRKYLESIGGIGSIAVVSVDPVLPEADILSVEDQPVSWPAESPTKKNVRRSRVSKRPGKV